MERSLIVVQTVDRNPFRSPRQSVRPVTRDSTVSTGSPRRLVSSVRASVRSVVRSLRRRSRQRSCHAPLLVVE